MYTIYISKDKIKSYVSRLAIRCFNKHGTYRNKLKTTYRNIISYFHKFSQIVLQVLMPVDNLKYAQDITLIILWMLSYNISTDLSSTDFPSLYFWSFSWAISWNSTIYVTKSYIKEGKTIIFEALPHNLTYFQPTIDPQPTQKMSATVCNPVIIGLSSVSPRETFTLSKNTKFQFSN